MYPFLVMFHSGWRYVVIVVLLVALVKFIVGWIGKREWSNLDSTLIRVAPIVLDIQWLLGLILWIAGTWWDNGAFRIAWEHPIILTLAVVLIHLISSRVGKSSTSAAKYRLATLGYIGVMVLIGAGVSAVLGSWNLFGSLR